MALTQTGRNLFTKFLTTEDSSSERFGSTGAYIHVGSSTGAFVSSQNSLLSTAAAPKGMNATYPQRATNVWTLQATFTTAEANFQWEEWGVKNTTATSTGTGTMVNRKQEALGTKPNTQLWQVTATITVTT